VRRRVVVALVASSALGAVLLPPTPARAYVRFKNGGAPLYWKQSCVPVTVYTNGFENTARMSLDTIAKAVAAAAHAWSTDAVSCSADGSTHPYLEIVPTIVPGAGDAQAVPNDARNTIVFDRVTWGEGNTGYDTNGLGYTLDSSSPDGHIVDADIQIDAVDGDKAWANLDPGVAYGGTNGDEDVYDLQNTLTHEFGHFIGLAHTCYRPDGSGSLPPTDDKGSPVAACDTSAVTDVDETSVMYDSAMFQETSKRTLSPEDVRAVCEMYAPTLAHDPCALDTPVTGCAVGGPSQRGARPLAVGVVGLALAVARARRRRGDVSGSARARA
jgi:hypothetical protein